MFKNREEMMAKSWFFPFFNLKIIINIKNKHPGKSPDKTGGKMNKKIFFFEIIC